MGRSERSFDYQGSMIVNLFGNGTYFENLKLIQYIFDKGAILPAIKAVLFNSVVDIYNIDEVRKFEDN